MNYKIFEAGIIAIIKITKEWKNLELYQTVGQINIFGGLLIFIAMLSEGAWKVMYSILVFILRLIGIIKNNQTGDKDPPISPPLKSLLVLGGYFLLSIVVTAVSTYDVKTLFKQ